MRCVHPFVLRALLWSLVLCAPALAQNGETPRTGYDPDFILAAGDDERAWAITRMLGDRAEPVTVFHLPPAEGRPGAMRRVGALGSAPERIAARDGALVCVFAPTTGEEAVRPVRAFRVRTAGPAQRTYVEDARPLPPLTGDGELTDLVGVAGEVYALVTTPDGPSLLALRGARWGALDLPRAIAAGADLELVPGLGALAILERRGADATLWSVRPGAFDGDDDGGRWSRRELDVPAGATLLVPQAQRLFVLERRDNGYDVRELLRALTLPSGEPAQREPNTFRVDRIPARAAIAPKGGAIAFLWPEGEGSVSVRLRVVGLSGAELHDGPAEMRGPISPADVQSLALLMLAIAVLVLIFVVRPGPDREPHLPDGYALATPMRRAVGWLIDLAPGFALVFLIWPDLRAAPETLLGTTGPGGVWPLTLIIVQLIAVCTVTEATTGRTLGKLLMNTRTITYDGAHPTWWMAFCRNVVRGLLPPVAVFSVLNPSMAHPQAFQTLVVVRLREKR